MALCQVNLTEKTLRLFSRDFDPALLLADNYIPLPTLLLPRASLLDAGGFDHAGAPAGRAYLSGSAETRTGFSKPPRVTGSETYGSSAPLRVATKPQGATWTSWSTSNRGEPFLT